VALGLRALLRERNGVMLDGSTPEIAIVKFLIEIMRALLISTGITPPTPENERTTLLVLFLILIGLVVGTWLTFKFLVPLM
jgi:hypothetical protein